MADGQQIAIWPGAAVAVVVGIIYLAIAGEGTFTFRPSLYSHHIWVADSWLHGQLHLREELVEKGNAPFYEDQRGNLEKRYGRSFTEPEWLQLKPRITPPWLHDWSFFDGRYYGYWAPLPALIMLPYVAVAGVEASDMLVSCLIGAGTVLLTFLMIREAARLRFLPATLPLCVALTVFMGLGTVHFYMAVMGHVWFLTQIVATFFLAMAIWFVLRVDRGWVWAAAAGAAMGASFLSRNSVVVMIPFFLLAILAIVSRRADQTAEPRRGAGKAGRTSSPETRRLAEVRHVSAWLMSPGNRRRILGLVFAFCLPLVVAGCVQLAFNYARFKDVREDGWAIQLKTGANVMFKDDYERYGGLSLHYLPRNFYYYFLNARLRERGDGAWSFDPFGNGMFFVSPALLYVFLSGRRRNLFTIGLWVGASACLTLLLLFLGTGWYNFGNRYLLDLMPLAVLLVGIGMGGRLTRVSIALIALSVLVNAWGTYRFTLEQF